MTLQDARTVELHELKGFPWPTFPKVDSLRIENVSYEESWVEGDIVLKYHLSGEHEQRNHFKAKVDQEQDVMLGPVVAKFHVWIEAPKLWLALKLCIASFCSPEAKTSVDLPHRVNADAGSGPVKDQTGPTFTRRRINEMTEGFVEGFVEGVGETIKESIMDARKKVPLPPGGLSDVSLTLTVIEWGYREGGFPGLHEFWVKARYQQDG